MKPDVGGPDVTEPDEERRPHNPKVAGLLQKNVLNRRNRWRTRAELRYEIVVWIEHTYNRRRRRRALGKLTPVEFELAFTPDQTTPAAHAA